MSDYQDTKYRFVLTALVLALATTTLMMLVSWYFTWQSEKKVADLGRALAKQVTAACENPDEVLADPDSVVCKNAEKIEEDPENVGELIGPEGPRGPRGYSCVEELGLIPCREPDDPDPNDPDPRNDPEIQEPERQESEVQDAEIQEPEIQEPEDQEREIQDEDPNDPPTQEQVNRAVEVYCANHPNQCQMGQQGPQGETGPAGPQGPAGPEGPPGPMDTQLREDVLRWIRGLTCSVLLGNNNLECQINNKP